MPSGLTPQERDERPLLTPGDVAHLMNVDTKTVLRWANSGKIPSLRTLGGHRRFRREDIEPHMLPTQGVSE